MPKRSKRVRAGMTAAVAPRVQGGSTERTSGERPQVARAAFTERTRALRVAMLSGTAGAATLVGEVLGSRLLRPMVGSTAAAQAGAVAGVLGGIGLGAPLAARWLQVEGRSPRRLFQRAVGVTAVLAALAPWLAAIATRFTAPALVSIAMRSEGLGDFCRALLAVAFTVPFGVLSGSTFPALAALHGRGAGRATAVTGAASSIGAAAATLVATFLIAPAAGVQAGLGVAAVLAVAAYLFAFTFDASDRADIATSAAATSPSPDRRYAVAALVLIGFASSAWQLTFTRLGVLAFGASAFALAAATAAYTFSLAVGEVGASRWVDSIRAPRFGLAAVIAAACMLSLASSSFASRLPAWSAHRFEHGPPSLTALWSAALGMLVALMLPTVACVASAIPLCARIFADAGDDRARANGRALAAMAIGNVCGSLVGPLLILPAWSMRGALLAVAFALASASLVVLRPWAVPRRMQVGALIGVALVLMGAYTAWRRWDETALLRGPFLYAGNEDIDLGDIVRVRDGREATVAVRRDASGGVLLQIDGKIDATSSGDVATQSLVSLYPAVLAAHPRNVLVIGLGSGITVDAVRDVPGVQHVDVTELLGDVIDAARREFRPANHDVLSAPNVRTIRQDASLFVRGTRERYDVIVSEPSNPWVAGMADLFTVEALESARSRLNPGGVMAAWFHAYSTDAATFASVLATFRSVFPHCALVEMVTGQDYMALGFVEPVSVDVDAAVARVESPGGSSHLAAAGVADRGDFFGRFVAGSDGIAAMTRDAEVFHASDLRLEFRAPALLYNDAAADIFALFARAQDLPLAGLSPHGQLYASVLSESEPSREAALHARQMVLARAARDYDVAIAEGEQAVAANPSDSILRTQLAQVYLYRAGRRNRRRDPAGAEDDVRNAIELRPGPAEAFRAHAVLGDMHLAHNDFTGAAREYGAALDIALVTQAPSPELHVRMAQVLVGLGDTDHALRELDRAVRDSRDPVRRDEIASMRSDLAARAHVVDR